MRLITLSTILLWALIALYASACSFQVGIDYYGQTGVDKRVQTELAGKKPAPVQKYKQD